MLAGYVLLFAPSQEGHQLMLVGVSYYVRFSQGYTTRVRIARINGRGKKRCFGNQMELQLTVRFHKRIGSLGGARILIVTV